MPSGLLAMPLSSEWSIGLAGLATGSVVGFFVQRARLCTFGAIEDALIGQDWRRMKIFGLSLGLAILATQALIGVGALDPEYVTYLPQRMPVLGIVLGGFLFGIGMALVGTCGFGSLVRLGGGDLRSLFVILVFAISAFAALRGVLAPLRLSWIEAITIPMPGPSRSDLVTQIGRLLGFELFLGLDLRMVLSVIIASIVIFPALLDARLRRARRLFTAGVVIGLAIGFGWYVTSAWSDAFALTPRPQSLTFVAPVARAIFGVLAGQDVVYDFGVASVLGAVFGALLASLLSDEFRWEAFDDQREMRRHLSGAILMGTGGVMAGGCTIGQGLSAGSLLALSMPLALAAMMLGARLGIALMVGEAGEILARLRTR